MTWTMSALQRATIAGRSAAYIPRIVGKSLKQLIAEKDEIIQRQQDKIAFLNGEVADLKTLAGALQAALNRQDIPAPTEPLPENFEPLPISIANIIDVTARHFGVSYADIISPRRTLAVILPRQIASYLAKMLTTRTLPQIGRRMGGRDHTTILHSVRKIQSMVDEGSPIVADIAAIRSMLATGEPALAHDKSPSEHAGAST